MVVLLLPIIPVSIKRFRSLNFEINIYETYITSFNDFLLCNAYTRKLHYFIIIQKYRINYKLYVEKHLNDNSGRVLAHH